jgi:hypothetical protein
VCSIVKSTELDFYHCAAREEGVFVNLLCLNSKSNLLLESGGHMVMKLCLEVPPDSILVCLPWHGYAGHELIHPSGVAGSSYVSFGASMTVRYLASFFWRFESILRRRMDGVL